MPLNTFCNSTVILHYSRDVRFKSHMVPFISQALTLLLFMVSTVRINHEKHKMHENSGRCVRLLITRAFYFRVFRAFRG